MFISLIGVGELDIFSINFYLLQYTPAGHWALEFDGKKAFQVFAKNTLESGENPFRKERPWLIESSKRYYAATGLNLSISRKPVRLK